MPYHGMPSLSKLRFKLINFNRWCQSQIEMNRAVNMGSFGKYNFYKLDTGGQTSLFKKGAVSEK